jgi:hypothetical protein
MAQASRLPRDSRSQPGPGQLVPKHLRTDIAEFNRKAQGIELHRMKERTDGRYQREATTTPETSRPPAIFVFF